MSRTYRITCKIEEVDVVVDPDAKDGKSKVIFVVMNDKMKDLDVDGCSVKIEDEITLELEGVGDNVKIVFDKKVKSFNKIKVVNIC